MKKALLTGIVLILALGLCGSALAQDVNMDTLRTEIASTVIAEIYQTIQAEMGSLEVEATVQATPAAPSGNFSGGYGYGTWKPTPTYYTYLAEVVGWPKNTVNPKTAMPHMAHGIQFTVTWKIRNIGPKYWDCDFYFIYSKGQASLDGDLYMLPENVQPGETITFTRSFEALETPGLYNSYWDLVDNNGVHILKNQIWVGWQVDDWRDYE